MCDHPTSLSLHFNWDEEVFWILNSQLSVWVSWVIAYLYPKFLSMIRVYQIFSVLFPNHKPFPKLSINTSPESSLIAVTLLKIVILNCYVYYGRNGYTVHSSKVNDIGRKFDQKQWVSEWFSISVTYSLQITLFWFLCTLLIIQWLLVLILNADLFQFPSWTRFVIQ